MEIMPVDTVAHLIEAGALPDQLVAASRRWACAPCGRADSTGSGNDSLDEVVRVLGERSKEDEEESPAAAAACHGCHRQRRPRSGGSGGGVGWRRRTGSRGFLIADDDPQMRGWCARSWSGTATR